MSLTSLPSSSLVLPTSLPSFGSIYSSNFAAFERNNATYIFTPETFTLNPGLGFRTSSLYVYAENIVLGGTYRGQGFAGKTLGLYCDTLTLIDNVTIDVSGLPGSDGLPYASDGGSRVNGKPGQDGGTIDLFVQNNLEQQLRSVKLIANGGDGGKGGDSKSESISRLSSGGDGGAGGSLFRRSNPIIYADGQKVTLPSSMDPQQHV